MLFKDKEKRAAYDKIYYELNKKKKNIFSKTYRKINREKMVAYDKTYYQKNKEKIRERRRIYMKKIYKINPKLKLSNNLSRIICHSLKNGSGKNGLHWESLVPYTLNDLIKRLKKTLPIGYTWDDYINGKTDLHIDHIIPISVYNFQSYTDIDFQRCWALKNLQLLPAKENLKKSAKLIKHFQPSLLLQL